VLHDPSAPAVRADFTPGASPDTRDNLARVDVAVVDGAPVS